MTVRPRIIQITSVDDMLYALDMDGQIWVRIRPREARDYWKQVEGPEMEFTSDGKVRTR